MDAQQKTEQNGIEYTKSSISERRNSYLGSLLCSENSLEKICKENGLGIRTKTNPIGQKIGLKTSRF